MGRSIALGPKEHLGSWWMRNLRRLAIYLLSASAATASLGISQPGLTLAGFLGATLGFFVIGGLGCLPGMIVWLICVSLFPPEWSTLLRRTIAVLSGAIIGLPWQIFFASLPIWW